MVSYDTLNRLRHPALSTCSGLHRDVFDIIYLVFASFNEIATKLLLCEENENYDSLGLPDTKQSNVNNKMFAEENPK